MPEGDTIHTPPGGSAPRWWARRSCRSRPPTRATASIAGPSGWPGAASRRWTRAASTCSCASRATSRCTPTCAWAGSGACTGAASAGRRSPRRAWLVIRTPDHEVVQFDGPVLELMTESRTRFDLRLAALGPDIVADEFDERGFLRRLREDDPTRGIGDALLDQRTLAGIGNIWKSEACFLARGRPVAADGRGERRGGAAIVRAARPLMRESAAAAATRRAAAGLRACRAALPPLWWRPSEPAARATTTARPTGAPGVRR